MSANSLAIVYCCRMLHDFSDREADRLYGVRPGFGTGEGEVQQHLIFEFFLWVRSGRFDRTSPTSKARRSVLVKFALPGPDLGRTPTERRCNSKR
jgi:hypothetical protein